MLSIAFYAAFFLIMIGFLTFQKSGYWPTGDYTRFLPYVVLVALLTLLVLAGLAFL